jgi:hypothetical protein
MIWRPVLAGLCTLEEIERSWTLDDLMDAHEALDIKAEWEAKIQAQNDPRKG